MRQVIRLTESDLHKLVKKSINRILKESGKGLGYGLSDDEKRELRTKNGGFQPGTEEYEDYVDYDSGPFSKTFTRHLSPDDMRQRAHKSDRGKKKPLATSQKYVKHSKMPGQDEYNDYDEYVKNYLCDKYNGVYLDGYIAVPVDDRWGEEAYAIEQDFKKYGWGQDERIGTRYIEDDLMYDDSGYELDPNSDYIAFRPGQSNAYMEWDDSYGPYGTYDTRDLGDTPKIGTSRFMK